MSDEIPSPAGESRTAEPSGAMRLPWETALYDAVRACERRAAEAERERDEVALLVHKLRRDLDACRGRLENWQLRQAAWHREREMLRRKAGDI